MKLLRRGTATVLGHDVETAPVATTLTAMGETGDSSRTRAPASAFPYLPGLDGLRAIAIIGVLLYHGDIVWLPGGFLGVEVFFVVSGYLITVLLLREHARAGRIDMAGFWRRRARRLLPALVFYLAGSLGLAALFARDVIDEWREGLWAAVPLYAANWFGVFNEISYAEGFGRKSFLHHLWSLAIEEQFYLVWPVLLWAGLRFLGRRVTWLVIVAGIVGSTAWMWILHEPLTDPLRVYYGTDTRAAGLLVGAVLVFLWRPWEWGLESRVRRAGLGFAATVAGTAGLAGVGWAMWRYDLALPTADPLFRGGFLITSAFAATAIAGAVVPRTPLSAVLGAPPLRWIGTRSYGIYLWHWPIFQITRARVDVDLSEYRLLGLRLLLTAIAAEVSYQVVERPVRERTVRANLAAVGRPGPTRRALVAAPVAVAAVLGALGVVQVDLTGGDQVAVVAADVVITPRSTSTPEPPSPTPTATATPVADVLSSDEPGPAIVAPTPPIPTVTPGPEPWPEPATYDDVTFIGDSVMEGAAVGLTELLPDAEIDTLVGRHWFQAVEVVDERLENDDLGEAVVIHLGNNGPINEEMVDDVLGRLVDVELVVVVNVRVPLRWEKSVNEELREGVRRWDNTVLVNWYKRSNDKPHFFAADGVHIGERGRRSYVRAIAKGLGVDPDVPATDQPALVAPAPSQPATTPTPADPTAESEPAPADPTAESEPAPAPPPGGDVAPRDDSAGVDADGE